MKEIILVEIKNELLGFDSGNGIFRLCIPDHPELKSKIFSFSTWFNISMIVVVATVLSILFSSALSMAEMPSSVGM